MTVRKAASAGIWSTIDIVLRQGVQFVVSIVLARLLSPADFGIIALLTFFSNFSIVLVQNGLSSALIQRQQTTQQQESAIFWCNLLLSAGVALILLASAPFIASFYGYPVLAPLMYVAAAQVVLAALGAVQSGLLTRDLQFRKLAQAGLFSSVVSGAVGIVAALQGAGVWALAWQVVTATAINSALMWWASDWRPTFYLRLRKITGLLRFGASIGVANAVDTLYTQGFALLIGKLHGATELGFYNRAASTQMLPSGVLTAIIGRVALPLFSARNSDDEGLRRGVEMAIRITMLLNVPMMVGLALLAEPTIVTLFGPKWLAAAPILSILAIAGTLYPLHFINVQLLLARGRSGRFLRVEIAKKTLGILFVVVGSQFGVMGLAYSTVAFSVVALIINCRVAGHELGYGLLPQLRSIAGIALGAALMSAAVLLARPYVGDAPLLQLVALTILGAVVYFGSGFGLRLKCFSESRNILLAMRKP